MNAEHTDAMEMRATAQQYTGPSAGRIASLIPHAVSFERGWFPDDHRHLPRRRAGRAGVPAAGRRQRHRRALSHRRLHGAATSSRRWRASSGCPSGRPTSPSPRPPPRSRAGGGRRAGSRSSRGLAALLAAPLLLGHGLETAAANVAALGVAGALLAGLPGKTRRAFRS